MEIYKTNYGIATASILHVQQNLKQTTLLFIHMSIKNGLTFLSNSQEPSRIVW